MAHEDLIQLFVVPLNQASIRYVITGAMAAIVYGAPRLTDDIDLVVELGEQDAGELARMYPEPDYYAPGKEVVLVEMRRATRGHFNVIHVPSGLKADFYLVGRDPLHRWAIERKREIRVGDQICWVAPPEYVILRKLQFYQEGGAEKHLEDIRRMLDISGDSLDMRWLESKAGQLGVGEVWLQTRSR